MNHKDEDLRFRENANLGFDAPVDNILKPLSAVWTKFASHLRAEAGHYVRLMPPEFCRVTKCSGRSIESCETLRVVVYNLRETTNHLIVERSGNVLSVS